ncbi:MAG: hypothetical protein MIO93_03820 [ANME-2 cluster archaeon]|jgi:hypothetical protein|nr:hypothetical protein [ANME-2 cluster archaeon]
MAMMTAMFRITRARAKIPYSAVDVERDDQDEGEELEQHAHNGACEDDGCAHCHLLKELVNDVGHWDVEKVWGINIYLKDVVDFRWNLCNQRLFIFQTQILPKVGVNKTTDFYNCAEETNKVRFVR